MSDVRLLAALRSRGPDRLDAPRVDGADPTLDDLREAAPIGPLWLAGGEPTLRPDLPDLVAALADRAPLGLITDGLALADERIARSLRERGLRRVRIGLHAAQSDAHDWLAGVPGAGKRVMKALRACAAADLDVGIEVVVTRPTTPLLTETVEVAARLGARHVTFRRIEARGPAAGDFVALSPRFGLLEPYLEAAASVASRAGMTVRVTGFPACATPRIASLRSEPEPWIAPVGLDTAPWEPGPSAGPCGACSAGCRGAPADYVNRFGWTELGPGGPASSPAVPAWDSPTTNAGTARQLGVTPPPVRGQRAPATRVRFAVAQSARKLDGDPLAGTPPGEVPEVVEVTWTADEPTRAIRVRLVRLAQIGARTLRVTGTLAHPEAADLLKECTRLSFPEVVVASDPAPMAGWTAAQRARLRGITFET
jgi:hypothetical protein